MKKKIDDAGTDEIKRLLVLLLISSAPHQTRLQPPFRWIRRLFVGCSRQGK